MTNIRVGQLGCLASVVAATMFVLLSASRASACEPKLVCLDYRTELVDDDPIGTIHLNDANDADGDELPETIDAAGARVTLVRPAPEPSIGAYLDAEGCLSFDSQFHAGHKLIVYPEAVLGTSRNIRIKITRATDDFVVPGESWQFEYVTPGEPGLVLLPPFRDGHFAQGLMDADATRNIMAIITHAVSRADAFPGALFTSGHDLEVIMVTEFFDYAFQAYSSDLDRDFLVLGVGADASKFLIGHELGHWMMRQAIQDIDPDNNGWAVSYAYGGTWPYDSPGEFPNGAQDLDCQFIAEDFHIDGVNENSHGIRSAEHTSAALAEGFAHYFAAVAFNDIESSTGAFRYYKDIDTDAVPAYLPFEAADNLVILPGTSDPENLGGRTAWVENMCSDDWNYPYDPSLEEPQEISSEIDWFRLFWEFTTSQDPGLGDAPGFWDVAHLVAFTDTYYQWDSEGAVFPRIMSTLADPGAGLGDFEDRFATLSADHGVYNEPP